MIKDQKETAELDLGEKVVKKEDNVGPEEEGTLQSPQKFTFWSHRFRLHVLIAHFSLTSSQGF